jgi:hypothetical protein
MATPKNIPERASAGHRADQTPRPDPKKWKQLELFPELIDQERDRAPDPDAPEEAPAAEGRGPAAPGSDGGQPS